MRDKKHPRILHIAGQNIWCESEEDRDLLRQAMELETDPPRVLDLSIGRLQLMKDACQRYSLGKYQRLISLAIDGVGR